MKYDVISADCHLDMLWLPPDLFTSNAAAAFRDRMPFVTEGPRGREWVTKNGASFGLDAGMGSARRQYVPGVIHRSDRMAATGLYDGEQKQVRIGSPGRGNTSSDSASTNAKSGDVSVTIRLNGPLTSAS